MDSNLQSPLPDDGDAKTTFRKPSTDAANGKYRRHTGSSSSDEILKRDPSCSPNISRDDPVKVSEHQPRRKDDGRELERNSRRSYSRSGESYRHSDRQSSRGSHGYSRHDDYVHANYANEEERNHKRLSSHSGQEAKGGYYSEHTVKESEQSRLRDYSRKLDKYSRDKYDGHRSDDKDREASSLVHQKYREDSSSDRAGSGRRHSPSEEVERGRYMRRSDGRDEKRDYYRSSGDYRGGRLSYEETWAHRNGSTSGGNSGNHHLKDAYKSDPMDLVGQRLSKEEKKKNVDRETKRYKGQCIRESIELVEDKFASVTEKQEFPAKKPKLHSLDEDVEYGKDVKPVSKFSSVAEDAKVTPGQGQASDSNTANDLNTAKVAAMKAAELVNRNLVGVGTCMTTDQKKKLLWGNKKNTTAEESGRHWDTALFSDRERQEKFNKLMSLRLHWYLWPIVGCEGRLDVGAKTRQPGWGRPSSREAERTPAGFRKAIHCWTPTKGRSYRWIRSLSFSYGSFCTRIWCSPTMLCIISLYNCRRVMLLVILYLWEDMHCWDFSDLGKRMVLYDISNLDTCINQWFCTEIINAKQHGMAAVCSSLRDRCRTDHFWDKHMKHKWGGLMGDAAYREWQRYVASRKTLILLDQSKKKGFFESTLQGVWTFPWFRPKLESSSRSRSSLPVDSIMAWYLSLESGKIWFPAQVYNRENGNVGFLLSCYDALLRYDSQTDTFQARYSAHGRRTQEENIEWDRLRAPPVDTPPYVLHVSDCLNELKPGDHIEIQWRRKKEFPHGWWYAVISHLERCDRNENHCCCHHSDMVILEFNQYTPGSRWRQTVINRKEHQEEGNEVDGFYGGIRTLNKEEIARWKRLWPTQILE